MEFHCYWWLMPLLSLSLLIFKSHGHKYDVMDYTFYYQHHHYEFHFNDLIRGSNNNILIEDDLLSISVLNASSLSFKLVDTNTNLDYFDDTHYDEISYTYQPSIYPSSATRRILIEGESKWIGCYKDTADRAFRKGPHQYGYNIETCAKACEGDKYFALQDNGWCSCENDFAHATKYGNTNTCPESHLGGEWGNDVFEVTASHHEDIAPDRSLTGNWKLLLRLKDVKNGYFESAIKTTGNENEWKRNANTFSILGRIKRERFIDPNDNKYTFKLLYKNKDGTSDSIIWKQSSWPSISNTIEGYEAVSVPNQKTTDTSGLTFKGLGLSSAAQTYLDGNGAQHSNWWNSVGSIQSFQDGIPAFNGKIAWSESFYVFRPPGSKAHKAFTQFKDKSNHVTKGKLIGERKLRSFESSKNLCRYHYGDMVSIKNEVENSEVYELCQELGGKCWIGLQAEPNPKTWDDVKTWVDGTAYGEYKHWQPGEPNNAGGTEKCTEMYSNTNWNDIPCSAKKHAICHKIDSTEYDNFVAVHKMMTFIDAEQWCKANYGANAGLAIITSFEDNENIRNGCSNINPGTSTVECWIGLEDTQHKFTQWKDSAKTPVTYTRWLTGNPKDSNGLDCAVMKIDNEGLFGWMNINCIEKAYFICNKGISSSNQLQPTEPYKWIGCYKDTDDRALTKGPHQYGYNIETCFKACQGYKYFALQNNGWCCCENDFAHATKYGKTDVCPESHLGGYAGNDIFQVLPNPTENNGDVSNAAGNKWIGCYKDTEDRAFRKGPHQYGYNIETCAKACEGDKYFALQNNGWCSCENDFAHATKYGNTNTCPESHLGGEWGNDVFEVTTNPEINAPSQANGAATTNKWIGCYKDTADRAFRKGPHQYGYNIETCSKACEGDKYFALQDNGWCSCENDFSHATKYGKINTCPESHLGGGWGNDVFEVIPQPESNGAQHSEDHLEHMNEINQIMSKHGEATKQHIHGIKDEILKEMKDSFGKNNEKTVLLNKIDDLRHQQTQLDLEHKMLTLKKQQKEELDKQSNGIIQRQMEWEKQREQERHKRMQQRQQLLQQQHHMRMDEHYQLMNGLKGFLLAFNNLMENSGNDGTQMTVNPGVYQSMDHGNTPINPGNHQTRYETRWTKFAHFNRPPPLMPPVPPLPPPEMMRKEISRRLIHDDNALHFIEVSKCKFDAKFGSLCIKYWHENNMISFDIMIPTQKALKQEQHRNVISRDIIDGDNLYVLDENMVFFDPIQGNVGFNIWKYELMDYEYIDEQNHENVNEYGQFDDFNNYIHYFIVYQYELNQIYDVECTKNNNNTLPLVVCITVDGVIYFDNVDRLERFENERLIQYMESFQEFEFMWMNNEDWDEIINFDDGRNHVKKCANLAITTLCIDNFEQNSFMVELKFQFVNQLI